MRTKLTNPYQENLTNAYVDISEEEYVLKSIPSSVCITYRDAHQLKNKGVVRLARFYPNKDIGEFDSTYCCIVCAICGQNGLATCFVAKKEFVSLRVPKLQASRMSLIEIDRDENL